MKNIIFLTFFLFSVFVSSASCKKEDFVEENQVIEENMRDNTNPKIGNTLSIKIGGKTFTATLLDSPTSKAFKALLPLTLHMDELNNNEKFAQLPQSIPTNASVPTSIQSGDLMLYGSRTLVLFYKSFSTSYSYTKIGKIDDVSGLLAALGGDDVKVVFEIAKD
jgi:hypothetical protein